MLSAYCTVLQLFLTLHGIWTDILQVLFIYKGTFVAVFRENSLYSQQIYKMGVLCL